MKNRLLLCTTHHGSNSFYATVGATFPTRVLDVHNNAVRLWEPGSCADSKIHGPYLCLSYCWGTEPFLGTNSDNIEAHKVNIPWNSLPRTFQDAIDITRRLGYRFLWIDGLCIIQADNAD